jgi:hypothetical protein
MHLLELPVFAPQPLSRGILLIFGVSSGLVMMVDQVLVTVPSSRDL